MGQETNVFVFTPVEMRYSLIHAEAGSLKGKSLSTRLQGSVEIPSWPHTLREVLLGILPIIQQVQHLRLEGLDTHYLSKERMGPTLFSSVRCQLTK